MGILDLIKQSAANTNPEGLSAGTPEEGERQRISPRQTPQNTQDRETQTGPSKGVPADLRTDEDLRALSAQQRAAEFQGLREYDPAPDQFTGWGQDFVTMGLGEKAKRSWMKGVASVVEMPGELIELATMYTGALEPMAEWFYKEADKIRGDNQVVKSMELEDFDWGDLGNIEFWATNAAEQIPYMAALVGTSFIGGAGAANLSTKIASKLIKKGAMRGASRGIATYTTTAGRIAKVDMDIARQVAQAVGGGFTQNMMVGAGAAHEAKELALSEGMSKEQAYAIASETYLDNTAYLAVDMASWYSTFRLGGNIGKAFNKSLDKINTMNKGVGRSLARASVNTAKIGAGMTIEGIEEQFQEVYEEWIVQKNVAEAKGEEFMSYMDFFQSPEMKEVRGTAAALGALFGGIGNTVSGIAERKAYIQRKTEATLQNKTMEEYDEDLKRLKMERVINQAVVDGEHEHLATFWADMEQRGEINQSQVVDYAAITNEFVASYETALEQSRSVDGGLNEAGARVLQNLFVHKRGLEREVNSLVTNFNKSYKAKKEAGATQEVLAEMQNKYQADRAMIDKELAVIEQNRKNLVSGKKKRLNFKDGIRINYATGEVTVDPKKAEQAGVQKGEKITLDDVTGLSEAEFNKFRTEGGGQAKTLFESVRSGFSNMVSKFQNTKKKKPEETAAETDSDQMVTPTQYQAYDNFQPTQDETGVRFVNQKTNEPVGSTEAPLRYNPEQNKFFEGDEEVTRDEAIQSLENAGIEKPAEMLQEIENANKPETKAAEQEFADKMQQELDSVQNEIEFLDDAKVEEVVRRIAKDIDSSLSAAEKQAAVDRILDNIKAQKEQASAIKGQAETDTETGTDSDAQPVQEIDTTSPQYLENFGKAWSLSERRLDWYNTGSQEISQALHMNQVIKERFPRLNNGQGISTVLLYRLIESMNGVDAVAYSIGSTIYLTRGYAKRPEFFEEMGHVIYSLYKDTPVVQERVKQLLKKKGLLAQIKNDYADQLLYDVVPNTVMLDNGQELYLQDGKLYYTNSGVEAFGDWVPAAIEKAKEPVRVTGKDLMTFSGTSTIEETQALYTLAEITQLPDNQQEIILDELFAKDLMANAPSQYSVYFNKADEGLRKKVLGNVAERAKRTFMSVEDAAAFAGVETENLTVEGALQLFEDLKTETQDVNVGGRSSRGLIAVRAKRLAERAKLLAEENAAKNVDPKTQQEIDTIAEKISGENLETAEDQETTVTEGDHSEMDTAEIPSSPDVDRMTFDKRNFGSLRNKRVINAFIRNHNAPLENEVISKSKIEGATQEIANQRDVTNAWEFVAALEQSTLPEVQAFMAYINEQFGNYAPNVLQGFYMERKSTHKIGIQQNYISPTGEMAVQEASSPTELMVINTITNAIKNITTQGQSVDLQKQMGIGEKAVFSVKNKMIKELIAFAKKGAPSVLEAEAAMETLLSLTGRFSAVIDLSFRSKGLVYHNGQYINPILAFQQALNQSLKFKDQEVNFRSQQFINFMKNFFALNRVMNGQSIATDVNGNYTTVNVKTNTLLLQQQKIQNEWEKFQNGEPNNLGVMLGLTKAVMRDPMKITDAYLRNIVVNGLQVRQYGGVNISFNTENSKTYKELTERELLLNNLLSFLKDFRSDSGFEANPESKLNRGYWQMVDVHGNSNTNYSVFVPYVEYNKSGERNNSIEARNTKKNALKYFNDPNAEAKINEYIKENVKAIKQYLRELPEETKGLVKGNQGIRPFANLFDKDGNLTAFGIGRIQNFVENSMYNDIMTQRALYGESQEFVDSDGNFDLVNRVARAKEKTTPGIQIMNNTSLEILPIRFSKIEIDGQSRNVMDGDQFILPEQVEAFKREHGASGLITQNLKMIMGGNHNFEGKNNYIQLKSMTFVLTDSFIKNHPHLKAIRDAMRSRYEMQVNRHRDYVIIAAPMDAIKTGKYLKDNAVDITGSSDLELATKMTEALDKIYGSSQDSHPIAGDGLRIVQHSDITKKAVAVPVQFISALYSHAKAGSYRKTQIDKVLRTYNEYRMERLNNILAPLEGVTKQDIRKISEVLNKIIDSSESSEIQKSMSFLNNMNLPQFAQAQLDLLANQFKNQALKPKQNGTMGLHISEYAQYKVGEDGKPKWSGNDALQPAKLENGKIVPGGIILPWHMKNSVSKGSVILVSRVPAHGLQTTVPMEVKGFSTEADGNRVQTNTAYAEVMGGDHDGDHLYINAKDAKTGSDKYNEWFDSVLELLTSEEYFEDANAAINAKQLAAEVLGDLANEVETDGVYKQFSPIHKAAAFREAMNNSIGIVASANRLGFILRAEEVELKNPINILGKQYNGFKNRPTDKGANSVAYQAQQLLQIVLDNAKLGYATKMNLTQETSNMFAFLVNMGVPVKDVYQFFNNAGVDAYIQASREVNNVFHGPSNLSEVEQRAQQIISEKFTSNRLKYKEALASLETIVEIDLMTSEMFDISKMVSQHNNIISAPAEMESMISNFESLMNGNSQYFKNLEGFKKNPEISHYVEVSKRYLEVAKKISILGSDIHTNLYMAAENSFRGNNYSGSMHRKRLENMTQVALNSLALASNVEPAQYYRDLPARLSSRIMLMKKANPNNRFLQMLDVFGDNIKVRYDMREKSAINLEIIEDARRDFEMLSNEIKRDLLNYDLLTTGLSGPNTMSVFFDKVKLSQLSEGIKNVMTNDVLSNGSSVQQQLQRRVLGVFMTSGAMSTPTVASHLVNKADSQGIASFNKDAEMVDKARYVNEIDAIFKNQPFILGVKGQERKQFMLYKPMSKSIHSAFMQDYNNALNKNDKWEVFKEYMPQMGFEFLANQVKDVNPIDQKIYLISSEWQTNTKGGQRLRNNVGARRPMHLAIKKKGPEGRASRGKGNYYNQRNDRELTYQQFLETYDGIANSANFKAYQEYSANFNGYKKMAEKMTQDVLDSLSSAQLTEMSKKAMKDNYLASGAYTDILNRELATRAVQEQMKLTGVTDIDNRKDVNTTFKWLGSENVSEKNPHLQMLYRTFEEEYDNWQNSAAPEIDRINKATENLIAEKFADFPWWRKMLVRLIGGRKFYEKLYENLIEWKIDAQGRQTYEEMSLISPEKAENLSAAEKAFYDVFTEMTKKYGDVAEAAGTLANRREGYVPHMQAEFLEAIQTKGLAGFYWAAIPKNQKAKNVVLEGYDPITGHRIKQTFGYFESVYLSTDTKMKDLMRLGKLRAKAEFYANKGTNQDGSPLKLQQVEADALLGGSQFSRFDKQRSMNAKLMPSLDLNHALTTYVRATIFRHGDMAIGGKFAGLDALMPIVDGVIQIKNGAGAQNTAEIADKLFRQRKLMQQSQTSILGKVGDAVINQINKVTIFAGLGLNVTAGIGNIIAGKYAIMRNNGGEVWAKGEGRYWGFNEKDQSGWLNNMRKRQEFLKKIGLIDESFYYDYSLSKRKGLKSTLEQIALAPMTLSENWIQGANLLGMLTDEEYNSIQANGTHDIDPEKLKRMIYDIRRTHGRGYTQNTERMLGLYSLGRSFQMFKKYIFTNMNERFGPEITNMYGDKEIGSMNAFGHVARDVISGRMSATEFKDYYHSLPKHKQEGLNRAVRGMGMFTVLALILAQIADDDDEPESFINKSARKNIQRAYNDVAKYYDITQTKRLVTPYPYYTLQNATRSMADDISLTRETNVTIK